MEETFQGNKNIDLIESKISWGELIILVKKNIKVFHSSFMGSRTEFSGRFLRWSFRWRVAIFRIYLLSE